jgi:SAM-dependent methyltransferase
MQKRIELLRSTFNKSAKSYDQVRPGYPEELIDDVLVLSSIPKGGKILEIGCGTGKATEMFATRGYAMLCLDLGPDLAAVAEEKFRALDNVRIVTTSFEDWDPGDRRFDLIIAATSFHWVDPAIAYVKSSAVLKPAGSLVIFWNTYAGSNEGFFHRVQDIYRICAPSMKSAAEHLNQPDREPLSRALFHEPVCRSYRWAREFSAQEYIDLLGTYSDHIRLPEAERRTLFLGIADLINQEFEGRVLKHYETILRIRRKRDANAVGCRLPAISDLSVTGH